MKDLPNAEEASRQAMEMDIINKGGAPEWSMRGLVPSPEITALRAENERLREALNGIAHREPWRGRKDYDRDDAGLADYWSHVAKEFQATALAALSCELRTK